MLDLRVYSELPELSFLQIPTQSAALALAIQYQLERNQWLSAETIEQRALEQIQQVLQHAKKTVPYYRKTLKNTSVEGALTPKEFQKIPLLTRASTQNSEASMVSEVIPASHGKTFHNRTSGSTGKPVTFMGTDVTLFYSYALTVREHLWQQRDITQKLISIRYFSKDIVNDEGVLQESWGKSTRYAFPSGPCLLLNITTPIKTQVDKLIHHQPSYLLTYPSNLQALVNAFKGTNHKLKNLKQIMTVSETLTEDLRQQVKDCFNVDIADTYSAEEVGPIAFQCPKHDHYHVQSENVYVEILDENHKPCKPGETGEVFVTSLNNFATPFIRYQVGDLATVGHPCDCHRGQPVIEKFVGRTRNKLQLPNGKTQFLHLGQREDYRKITQDIIKHQLSQDSLTALTFRVMTKSETLSETQKQQLAVLIQQNTANHFQVTIEQVNNIPQTARGKFEEFIPL